MSIQLLVTSFLLCFLPLLVIFLFTKTTKAKGSSPVSKNLPKARFHSYTKGIYFRTSLFDILGNGIFNVNGDSWKFQRQISSYEFNTNSLRKFVEITVETELSERLIPFLSATAANRTVIDFQGILQRFAFDNICKIAFGYDPAYLLPSLPQAEFVQAFDDAISVCTDPEVLEAMW